ncbi:MAG: hypothetical protein IJL98_07785 [Lachnospiraceae bacterium]|nr:hypothetical protein [Lachnospiraceae bacterium]
MVRKLMKYEFAFYFKRLLPLGLLVLGTALLNRILQFFEADNTPYRIIFGSSVVLLVIAILASIIGTLVIAVGRFYKNIFSNEGYLTMSLPASSEQHIAAKLTAALVCSVLVGVFALLGVSIATSGEVFAELVKAFVFLMKNVIWKAFGGHTVLYIVWVILALCTASVKVLLVCYTCICIGQLAKKNRIVLAVVCYFGYYFICQILGTVFIIIMTLAVQSDLIEQIMKFIGEHLTGCIHAGFVFVILWNLIFSAVYFLISNRIIKRKLNLE